MNIVTIHYNTPTLTCALLHSIHKQMGEGHEIIVFDNSDRLPFVDVPYPAELNVTVIDNTNGKYIDFSRELSKYPDKTTNPREWGSAKHSMSIDYMFDVVGDGFLLLDADTLVRKDLSELADNDYAAVTDFEVLPPKQCCVERFLPYCQWLNVPMLKRHSIRYFNGDYMWRLRQDLPYKWYDTGAWLSKIVRERRLPWKRIHHDEYVAHLWHGSFHETEEPEQEFLTLYEELWKK